MKKAYPISINLNIRGISQSPTLAINEKSRLLQSQGKTIYTMGLGQSPFPVPQPVVETLKLHAGEKDYLPVKGLYSLREAVSHFHSTKEGINIDASQVLIGPGSKELMFILQLSFYGDILLPTPCWVSYVPQARIIGRNTFLIHTQKKDKWRLNADILQQYLDRENDRYKPRLLVLNYPSNPDGGTYSEETLKALAKVARNHNMIILSDEIYGELHYEGNHVSIARFYPEGTIISSGLSKWCGAGGWRLGTFTFPKEFSWLLNAMAAVASETYTSVSAPIQYAAVKAFQGGIQIERYLWHVRRILKKAGYSIAQMLQNAGVDVLMPEGAFYLFLDFSPFSEKLRKKSIKTSAGLCTQLLDDAGVALLPGSAFQRPDDELTARLAFVNFDGATALAFSETIPLSESLPEHFLEHYCSQVIQGIKAIVNWTGSL